MSHFEAITKVLAKDKSNTLIKSIKTSVQDEKQQKQVVYQVLFDIHSGKDFETLINEIKKTNIYSRNHIFESAIKANEESQFYLENPLECEKGVLKCGKCGSDRTWTATKQVRSADEGTSVFAKCSVCKHTWTHSG
jgi:DNA-directed RNA polymerase subunit M/transcription elongation factor TFIIS